MMGFFSFFERVVDLRQETALMEDSLRPFVEECDSLQVRCLPVQQFHYESDICNYLDYWQGIQLIHDTSTFGSFIDSFLVSFRDEFSKHSILSFPLLSDSLPASIDVNDVSI
jgi:hypothetical protein